MTSAEGGAAPPERPAADGRVLVLGAGGHARVVIDALRALGIEPVGIVDSARATGDVLDGVTVLGTADELGRLAEVADAVVIGLGSIGDTTVREAGAAAVRAAGLALPSLVHPSATVSPAAALGDGAFVAAGAVVGPGAVVGECCIVNTGAVVDHDSELGAFAHVGPGAALSGNVRLGDRAHVGTGAAVAQGVTIGACALVGAGSAVVEDVRSGVVAFGNPCREQRPVGEGA